MKRLYETSDFGPRPYKFFPDGALVDRNAPERRRCNDCGEEWVDPGHAVCIFCQSEDTELIEDD